MTKRRARSIGARLERLRARLRSHPLAHLGPGLITGVADDDPSGIATYSQAGAQFGLDMLWTMPVSYPLMAAVQSMCARIGRVTGKGLAANIKETFHPAVLAGVLTLLLTANVLNIAADVAAMGEVAALVVGGDRHLLTAAFVLVTLLLQILVPYHRYVRYLKWLTVSLLAYAAVLFAVHVPWRQAALRTLWPHGAWDGNAATVVVGVFGTTISPYLFFWQASEEIEDLRRTGAAPLNEATAAVAHRELRRMRWDNWGGMLYSNAAAYCIILATAVTLYPAGLHDIETAAQAAGALRPIAGEFAYLVFALGILGVGLIGVPVLAGSGGYALAEAFDWPFGLEREAGQARGFYAVIAVSVLLALGIQYSPITPMKALFWSAVINGIVAVPLLAVIVLLASKPAVMGAWPAGRTTRWLGWLTVAVMAAAAVRMFLAI